MLDNHSSNSLTGRTILFVDDDRDALSVLTIRCENEGLKVVTARNTLTALSKISKHAPDAICVDVEMPTGDGLDFCELLAGDPQTASIPRIVITGNRSQAVADRSRRVSLALIGKGNDVWSELQAALLRVFAKQSTDRGVEASCDTSGEAERDSGKTVVVADDDDDVLQLLTTRFRQLGCTVVCARTALDALNAINRVKPELVCLDVSMPLGSGLSVCEMMASDPRLRSIPAIILTGRSDPAIIQRCHEMMVFYVAKSADTWSRVEPIAREHLGLAPLVAAGVTPALAESASTY